MDLRTYIEKPETLEGLSVEYEIAKRLYQNPNKTQYFNGVKGYKFDVVGNVITSRDEIYVALGTDKENYISDVERLYHNPVEPIIVENGECQEGECSIDEIPILRHFEKDGARYITSGLVIVNDPEYGRNVSIHRLMLLDDNRLGIRIVPRHLRKYLERAEARGEDLEVAIAIGVHPTVFFAASFSPPIGYDEFSLVGAIINHPMVMVKCKTVNLEVPTKAEFVLEGKILCNERGPEGPFADVTGTYDRVRDEPLVEITKITHRKGAIYQALLPSSIEHRLFMGMPREPRIYSSVNQIASVSNACLTDGGRNWLQGAVALKKGERDMKKVIEQAFAGHPSMKHVIIVDDDIDIFDPKDIEYAISTRFQAHKDTYVFKNMRGSTLDPSTDEDGMTSKVGIDATIPSRKGPEYEFAKIP
jgi:UbiD family decarboxylase